MNKMQMNLDTACNAAQMAIRDLQSALDHADAVTALILLPLIEQMAKAQATISALNAAIK